MKTKIIAGLLLVTAVIVFMFSKAKESQKQAKPKQEIVKQVVPKEPSEVPVESSSQSEPEPTRDDAVDPDASFVEPAPSSAEPLPGRVSIMNTDEMEKARQRGIDPRPRPVTKTDNKPDNRPRTPREQKDFEETQLRLKQTEADRDKASHLRESRFADMAKAKSVAPVNPATQSGYGGDFVPSGGSSFTRAAPRPTTGH